MSTTTETHNGIIFSLVKGIRHTAFANYPNHKVTLYGAGPLPTESAESHLAWAKRELRPEEGQVFLGYTIERTIVGIKKGQRTVKHHNVGVVLEEKAQ